MQRYSILIKNGEKSYVYYMNSDGEVFAGDSEATKAKVTELLEVHPVGKIKVVHNVTLTADIGIVDVE